MKQILVLYYSRTGNTERMAKAVAEGAKISDDVKVELNYHVEPEDLKPLTQFLSEHQLIIMKWLLNSRTSLRKQPRKA